MLYKKEILSHLKFNLTKFIKNSEAPYLVFIHGGPGYNSGTIEYLIEYDNLFQSLDFNLVLYDQRTCGRSLNFPANPSHANNVNDLEEIYNFLIVIEGLNINGFIGHSYGAKLLYDFYKIFKLNIPGIFVSTAKSILTPRLNNLMLDLVYLKKVNTVKYNEVLSKMNNVNLQNLWLLTEELAPLFQENEDRHYQYWANLKWYEKIQNIQKRIKLPINTNTFMSVRKDLYSTENNFSVEIDTLKIPYLWINGFHDFVMNGSEGILSKQPNHVTFYKSSHYPHIEENNRFSEITNEFINLKVSSQRALSWDLNSTTEMPAKNCWHDKKKKAIETAYLFENNF